MNNNAINTTINEMFKRYGSPSNDVQIDERIYLVKPDTIKELERIVYYDNATAEHIQSLERTIENLKIYRLALQEQYNYIATAPTVPIIKLTRRKNYYNNKVNYYLTTYRRNILDGSEIMIDNMKYAGKERNKAINDLKEYQKKHCGIITEIDISIK